MRFRSRDSDLKMNKSPKNEPVSRDVIICGSAGNEGI